MAGNKKRKVYYRKCAASQSKRCKPDSTTTGQSRAPKNLTAGLTGYLVTCNRNEHAALLESYRLLNDIHASCSKCQMRTQIKSAADGQTSDENLIEQLKRENVDLTEPSVANQRFQFNSTRTGVSNCIFITHHPCCSTPVNLAHSIFEDILTAAKAKSRHVLRFLPVARTCFANAEEIGKTFTGLWRNFLSQPDQPTNDISEEPATNSSSPPQLALVPTLNGSRTYLVIFKCRNYDRLTRDEAIHAIASVVQNVDSSWRACPTSPSVIIFVNVLRNVACLSILECFDRYRKYNIAELIQPEKVEAV